MKVVKRRRAERGWREMLANVQAHLHEHYLALRQERSRLGHPLYALEHDLAADQIVAIRAALSADLLRQGTPSNSYWLAWVVVATEVGYAFDGDEYWASFDEAVPGWKSRGDRENFRGWFVRFAERYGGFRPAGRWAQHFSIIAWPISHAILPRDLQGQFARHLFDLRFELALRADATVDEIGSLLQTEEPSGSSRFQHFIGQPELTARLVLALRDEDVQGTVSIISRTTLARIVGDLEQRQAARGWLRETRRVLRDARLRGIGPRRQTTGITNEHARLEPVGQEAARLIARQSPEGGWLLGIRLPDFSQMIRRCGLEPKFLDRTRIRLSDRPDQWLPGRALLTWANSEQRIKTLRDMLAKPTLVLEHAVQPLSTALARASQISGTSPWLLRIHEDGAARQSVGNSVRAGRDYLILTTEPLAPTAVRDLNLRPVDADDSCGYLYALSVPKSVGPVVLQALTALKIGYAVRANVEPIGLVPRWGADGRSVWLSNEEVLLHLSADHPVQEFTVNLDHRGAIRIPVGNPANVVVSLGILPVGDHVVEVGGLTSARNHGAFARELFELEVRSPTPWVQGVRQQAGFRAILEPPGSTLERVLAGRARIRVIGPSERRLAIEARFFNVNGHLSETVSLGVLTSLADEAALRRVLMKLTKEPLAEKVHATPRVDLAFLVEELGVDAVSFLHDVDPLRWRLAAEGHEFRARLIDEAGSDQPVSVNQYGFAQPDLRGSADFQQCLSGLPVAPPGALFTATCKDKRYAAVISVPPQQSLSSLTELGINVAISPEMSAPKNIPRLLALRRLWGNSRVYGRLGSLRKAQILEALEQRICVILCGGTWAERMKQCRTGGTGIAQLRQDIGASPGFASRILTTNWRAAPDRATREEFSRLAATYRVCDDPDLCALALRLAFAPEGVRSDLPDKGVAQYGQLAAIPGLARGAFLARLVGDLAALEQPASEVA